MESIFLSYTYAPHPDHAGVTATMVRTARTMVEALGLRVLDGIDMGGRVLPTALAAQIAASDALVAIYTPHATPGGALEAPPYVNDEFISARATGKRVIRVIHESLNPGGIAGADEYIPLMTGGELDAALKLLRTLALWKRELGRPREIRIEPGDLGPRLERGGEDCCQYKLLVRYAETEWRTAKVWHEPGAVFAYLPGVPEESKIRLKLRLDGETWDSQFTDPKARVALERRN